MLTYRKNELEETKLTESSKKHNFLTTAPEMVGSTTIRTNVKFGPNAGPGPKTSSDQKFKFGPKYSGN